MDLAQFPAAYLAAVGIGGTVLVFLSLVALLAFVRPRNPRAGWRYERTYDQSTWRKGRK